jgi:hypothetical protein
MVPSFLAIYDIQLFVGQGIGFNGTIAEDTTISCKGYYLKKTILVVLPDGSKVTLNGKVYIFQDIGLGKPKEKVFVKIGNDTNKYEACTVDFLRNPDGTINHYELGLK